MQEFAINWKVRIRADCRWQGGLAPCSFWCGLSQRDEDFLDWNGRFFLVGPGQSVLLSKIGHLLQTKIRESRSAARDFPAQLDRFSKCINLEGQAAF